MSTITITAPEGPVKGTLRLPRSKSVANRALIIASLTGDLSSVDDPGDAEDTLVLRRLLEERPAVLDCGAGGTTFRFLLAWAAVQEGEERLLTGIPRLLERPHNDLIEGLRKLGADIERTAGGCRVRGRRMEGGNVHFDSPVSSQFLSALLLVAPRMERGLRIRWTGNRLSEPYVEMTLAMMGTFGVTPRTEPDGVRVEAGEHYVPMPFTVPPDWSAAAFWYQIAALAKEADILLEGPIDNRLQGDRAAEQRWAAWVDTAWTTEGIRLTGRRTAKDPEDTPIGLERTPDLFQALVFTFAGRRLGARFTGLDNLPLKETDRLQATADALRAFGLTCSYDKTAFTLSAPDAPPTPTGARPFDPQGDHRMAMALAPMALVAGPVTLSDPAVTGKSYPGFWEDLQTTGFGVAHRSGDPTAGAASPFTPLRP